MQKVQDANDHEPSVFLSWFVYNTIVVIQNVLFHSMLKNFNSIIDYISNFLSFLFWNNLPIQNTVLNRSLNDMPTN